MVLIDDIKFCKSLWYPKSKSAADKMQAALLTAGEAFSKIALHSTLQIAWWSNYVLIMFGGPSPIEFYNWLFCCTTNVEKGRKWDFDFEICDTFTGPTSFVRYCNLVKNFWQLEANFLIPLISNWDVRKVKISHSWAEATNSILHSCQQLKLTSTDTMGLDDSDDEELGAYII